MTRIEVGLCGFGAWMLVLALRWLYLKMGGADHE